MATAPFSGAVHSAAPLFCEHQKHRPWQGKGVLRQSCVRGSQPPQGPEAGGDPSLHSYPGPAPASSSSAAPPSSAPPSFPPSLPGSNSGRAETTSLSRSLCLSLPLWLLSAPRPLPSLDGDSQAGDMRLAPVLLPLLLQACRVTAQDLPAAERAIAFQGEWAC